MFVRTFVCSITVLGLAHAQTVMPPFNSSYHVRDLGSIAGPSNYGGIAFKYNNPNVLVFGAYSSGLIVEVPLIRGGNSQITGFGTPTTLATVTGPDGGLAYAANNTLFYTSWGPNEVGQLLPGSAVPNQVTQLSPLGVSASVGSCAIPIAGALGAGQLKLVTWNSSQWYDATIALTLAGTYTITQVGPAIQLTGGPEGIVYPPLGYPLLSQHVLIAEWNTGNIVAYQVDNNGDPLPATAQIVISNASAPGGGAWDPLTGDLLFTHGNGTLLALRLGIGCGAFTNYGQGGAGLNGVPTIGASGCAQVAGTFSVQVGNGRPFAFGALVVGFQPANLPIFNLFLLNDAAVSISHTLDAAGTFALPIVLPSASVWGNFDMYFQAGYLDVATPFGFAASAGLQVHID